jgi:FkbM family methyltransferase
MKKDERIGFCEVGAAGALQPPWTRLPRRARGDFIRIDPTYANSKLKHKDGTTRGRIKACLSDKEENRKFFVCKKRSCSSLFKPNPAQADFYESKPRRVKKTWHRTFKIVRTATSTCIRLDSLIPKYRLWLDFLKIDTQGGDLDALKGAGTYLSEMVSGIQLEAFYKEMYVGIPLFDEIHSFLLAAGFQLSKTIRKNMIFGEFVYVHTDPYRSVMVDRILKMYGG